MAVWAKSTGAAFDQDLTVTGGSSGEEKTIEQATTRTRTTRKQMKTSFTTS